MAARPGLEPGPPDSESGVVPLPPPRSASGRRDSNSQPPAPEAGALPLRHVQVGCVCMGRTDGGIRTRTDGVLSAVPLPIGLRQRVLSRGGPRGIRTRNLLLAGELRFQLRHRPRAVHWSRGRESNPRAGRMRPRCTQCPRRVTGRTRTDFLRGHVPASRPLQTSATVDEEGFEPPASCTSDRRSTADLLVARACRCVGRRGVEPRRPAVSARCLPLLAHAPGTWSRECSNLPLPGFNRPLHRQSFETMFVSCVCCRPGTG